MKDVQTSITVNEAGEVFAESNLEDGVAELSREKANVVVPAFIHAMSGELEKLMACDDHLHESFAPLMSAAIHILDAASKLVMVSNQNTSDPDPEFSLGHIGVLVSQMLDKEYQAITGDIPIAAWVDVAPKAAAIMQTINEELEFSWNHKQASGGLPILKAGNA